MDKVFNLFSKGFDISKGFTKDEDLKDILIGISAIFAILVSTVKLWKNIKSIRNRFLWRK